MPSLYNRYLKIKDRLCVGYFGVFTEFLVQLIYLRPAIEKELPGLDLYIACTNEFKAKHKAEKLVGRDDFRPEDFAYVRELTFDSTTHPILDLIESSNLTLKHLEQPVPPDPTKNCLFLNKAIPPVGKLTAAQEEIAINRILGKGYRISDSMEGAGWVVGVESEALYEAAAKGIKTTLIPTGFGTKLFQKVFPQNEIWCV